MSLLSVGARALLANQTALQTTGHNIANVSVAGYSRQSVAMQTVQGQFSGSGYIGNGVNVATILRNHNELLTRQAAAAQAVQTGDTVRAERLKQLQDVFQGGTSGLGAAISDTLNSLVDVVAAPSDITARTVTLTRMNEMAARMRTSADQLHEIEYSVNEQLGNNATRINQLAQSIAEANEQIARVKGNGQSPNDLLDKRDQLIRELNQYVQTTQIPADDGSMGVFVGGSQALVLGSTAASVSLAESELFPGSNQMRLFFNRPGATPFELQEDVLGGGEVAGLLKFANNDLVEGRNLLGRMAQAIGMTMNAQNKLGLTLDGQKGADLFAVPASANGHTNSATAAGNVSYADPTQFAASDYEVRFNAAGAQVVRLSDGRATNFPGAATPPAQLTVDGLSFNVTGAGAAGERMLFKPFADAALNIKALVNAPRDLAAANPINAAMGTANGGTLQLASLKATGIPALTPPAIGTNVTLSFNGTGGFTIAGTAGTPVDLSTNPPTPIAPLPSPPAPPATYAFTSGQAISINGWSITLQGTPKSGDTVNIGNASDPQYGDIYTRNAGNASALMALRDVKMFDESKLADGYAGLMAQVGTRTQSASYAAQLSSSIASNLEADRTAVSGVNLDEEAARLIQYQQAYQASAKMLQIAQNIFDNLIQSMGR
ncbi:MAG TPA: flagellar hook-associated protein FlgK [Alicycliphilus sp.]|nr:flagellar hook-associated protein FlgK [Alicycliphilus sp.]